MVAPSPPLSRSLVAAHGRDSLTSLCARGAWSSLKALAARSDNNTNTTTGAGGLPSLIASTASVVPPARTVVTPHLIAIVGGAVGAAVALAVVLALVHVLRVRRKVERFRRSMNVLAPELASMPVLRSSDAVASIDAVAMSQVSPNAHGPLASGMPVPDSYLPAGTLPVISPTRPPRGLLPPPKPKPKLTIDVGISRAVQHVSLASAGPQTSARSPYEVVVPSPGPTSFTRHESYSAGMWRAI
ncbi:hypothetical protein EI94DRAFT_1801560 [Lactarius quietus]|nr:hypothetical protein EI94DRAFT_1801560 [Lactarius quietus]